jgi:uncharacterized damage-inducible protein DinB
MRIVTLVCLGLLTVASPAAAQLSQQDRDAAVKYLEDTRQKFLSSIEGLSEAQWKFKAGPDRWSIAETAEHIALSESLILGFVTDKISKAPAPAPDAKLPTDQKIIDVITDRSAKAQAPEFLKPTNKWPTREALTTDFKAARDKTIEYVKSTSDDLRAHAAAHPAMGPIDAYQWIILLSAHSARHTAQIEEVKTAPGYPSK